MPPRNIYGVHLLVSGARGRDLEQLRWARHLVGRWGHVKTLFADISAATRGPRESWKEFVEACYRLELIPVIRLGGVWHNNGWRKPESDRPGDYTSMAAAVKRVVEGLPRDDRCPLYIEVWNEPNLDLEWSGKADARQYAQFFVQTAAAIRSIGDSRIIILNGALALSPEFTEQMCRAVPAFVHAFDVWASHPYPMNRPPEINHHDGPVNVARSHTIDAYMLETDVLRRFGRDKVRVMITETGYDLGNDVLTRSEGYPIINETNRADYMARAYRDYWEKWEEVVAVFPFVFGGQGWERFEWVYPDSGTNPDGSPTRPHLQYTAVAALAKPTDVTGAISGKILLERFGVPVPGVKITCRPGTVVETDDAGCFYLPRLDPGSHQLAFAAKGFRSRSQSVSVRSGSNAVANMTLAPAGTGRLRGSIVDGLTRRPLDGVTLSVSPASVSPVKTDAAGSFDTVELLPVTYALTLSKPGWQTVTLPGIAVPVGQTRELQLPLGPKKGPDWPNELGNASFEQGGGGGGYNGIGLRYEPTAMGRCHIENRDAFSGRCSQAIDAPGDGITTIRQITHYNTAKVGRKYVAGVWCKGVRLTGEGASISLEFTDNGGGVIRRFGPSKAVRGTTDQWTYLEIEGVAPERSERVSFNMHVARGAGTALFDDAYLGAEPKAMPASGLKS